ncbi:MAG: serpin family protein [Chloroflexi bacterium]|nr:serpin family protein [Chloroflexota bacterium]
MKKILFLAIAAILLLPAAACATQPAIADVLKSDKPRLTPTVSPADMSGLVDGNNTFAFNLYQQLKGTDGNLFYSPHSISEALAMTYGGARGTTEQQMAAALQFKLSQNQLHPAFNNLDLELGKRGQGAKGKDDKGFRLNVVNAIWGQRDFPFKSDYLDLLAQNYGAGLRILDFMKSPEPSRVTINQWVSDQTEGKIKDLLPQGSITDLTRLVLTNAIYFNAAWLHPFDARATSNGTFHPLTGGDVTVPMMKQSKTYGYAKGNNYQAVELPYDGSELSMVIFLPAAEQFKAFEAALNSQQVRDIIAGLKSAQVVLTMPRFKVESQFSMKKTLSDMGMPVAFTEQADFSGMDGRKDLLISDVVHKAFVSVDEAGTEAAAATGVIVGVTSAPSEQAVVTLDHPFIFLIRDIKTGAILFTGRVMNPA